MEQSRDSSSDILSSSDDEISSADKFYKELDEKILSFKFPENEIEEIAAAVNEIVLAILKRVEHIDDRFKYNEVIRVGSFEEGARIQEPNEFDFLAVVDELSQPNAVEPVRVCEGKRGFMHVKVRDEALQRRWTDYMDNRDLLSFATNPSNPDTTNMSFSSLVYSIYMDKSSPIVVTKPSGTMKFAGVSIFREPNTVVVLAWKSKHRDEIYKITADLSPVILCHDVSKVITPDDCPYEHFYAEVQKYGKFLLIPGRSSKHRLSKCFNISLTEVEKNLVRSLGVTHKRCYRVLKYLLCTLCHELSVKGMVYRNLSSYIVKSAVLHHEGDGLCKSDSLNSCVQDVLYSLLNCLMKDRPYLPFMPSVFIQKHNLFKDFTNYHTSKSSATQLVMHVQCLMSALFFHQKIHALPLLEYDYEKCMRSLKQMKEQLEKAKTNIAILDKQFCDDEGKWKVVDMSTKDLLRKFGVPYKQ